MPKHHQRRTVSWSSIRPTQNYGGSVEVRGERIVRDPIMGQFLDDPSVIGVPKRGHAGFGLAGSINAAPHRPSKKRKR